MNIKPLFNNIIVKPIIVDEVRSEFGIVLANAPVDKTRCEVVAVGPGKPLDNGDVVSPAVKVGDTVIVPETAGHPVMDGREEYFIVDASKIVGVIPNVKSDSN